MHKPNNYDNTQAAGDFVPLEPGGHIMVIKKVEETTSKTGKDMLKISLDTAPRQTARVLCGTVPERYKARKEVGLYRLPACI